MLIFIWLKSLLLKKEERVPFSTSTIPSVFFRQHFDSLQFSFIVLSTHDFPWFFSPSSNTPEPGNRHPSFALSLPISCSPSPPPLPPPSHPALAASAVN
jgi:hypothetical protein